MRKMKVLSAVPLLAVVASATTYDCNTPIAGVADVVLPVSAESFANVNTQYSTLMGEDSILDPDLVAMCADEDEVVAAVNWARECDYKVSIRSGGHSYAGYSSCGPWFNSSSANGCMVLDVSQLEHYAMDVDAKQATFGVGWIIVDMLAKLDEYNWIVPAGICKYVGVGGHYQTSALGMATRSFGLGIDYVSSFRMVDASGEIRDVSEESDEDLYWAVLGGGAGSWGVILDYTFDVIEAADYPHSELRVLNFPYTHEIFVAVTNAWFEVHQQSDIARDLTSILVVGVPNEAWPLGNYNHIITMYTVWTGVDDGAFTDEHYDAYIQPVVDVGGTSLNYTWVNLPVPLDTLLSLITVEFDKSPFHYHVASKISKQQSYPYFGPDFAEVTATMIDDVLTHDDMFLSLQFLLVGSVHDSQLNLNTGRTAFAVRDTVIHLDDWIFFKNPEESDTAADLVASYIDDLDYRYPTSTPYNSATNSFMTPHTMNADVDVMEDEWRKWFPNSFYYHKLRCIKGRVDSGDLFSSAMTIPPTDYACNIW